MGKTELFAHFVEHFGAVNISLKRSDAREFFEELQRLCGQQLQDCGEFTLPGIAKLVLQKREARTGRNPATGEAIEIPSKQVVKARIAKAAQGCRAPRSVKRSARLTGVSGRLALHGCLAAPRPGRSSPVNAGRQVRRAHGMVNGIARGSRRLVRDMSRHRSAACLDVLVGNRRRIVRAARREESRPRCRKAESWTRCGTRSARSRVSSSPYSARSRLSTATSRQSAGRGRKKAAKAVGRRKRAMSDEQAQGRRRADAQVLGIPAGSQGAGGRGAGVRRRAGLADVWACVRVTAAVIPGVRPRRATVPAGGRRRRPQLHAVPRGGAGSAARGARAGGDLVSEAVDPGSTSTSAGYG